MGIERGKEFVPVTWVSEDEGFLPLDDVQFFYRFVRKPDAVPSLFVQINDGAFFDYNVGIDDHPGPDKPEWDRYIGKYQYKSLGQPAGFVEVNRQNGKVFLDYMNLKEFQPGLFFTGHAEALDLRGSVPRWRNIRLEKITMPAR